MNECTHTDKLRLTSRAPSTPSPCILPRLHKLWYEFMAPVKWNHLRRKGSVTGADGCSGQL